MTELETLKLQKHKLIARTRLRYSGSEIQILKTDLGYHFCVNDLVIKRYDTQEEAIKVFSGNQDI